MTIRRRNKTRAFIGSPSSEIWNTIFGAAYRHISRKRLLAAAALTAIIHAIAYFTAPETLAILIEISPAPRVELVEPEAIDVPEALLPEEFRKKNQPRFVPVNPEAPRATPQETDNHSAANQRAAQENPDPATHSRTPTHDGELEDSRGISQNVLPRELLPPEMRTLKTAPARDKNVPADEKSGVPVSESEDGTISRGKTAKIDEHTTEDAGGERAGDGEIQETPDPQARPSIAPPPGLKTLTMRSNMATNEIGAVSLDAKYSEFGDYTQRMLEAIQAAWYITVERSEIRHRHGSVSVQFTLRSDGTIKEAKILDSTAAEAAAYACLDAVESRAPFEVWGEEMIALFGEEQTSTIRFYYR